MNTVYLFLNTAIHFCGHSSQIGAASVSIREKKIKYRQRIKSVKVKDN